MVVGEASTVVDSTHEHLTNTNFAEGSAVADLGEKMENEAVEIDGEDASEMDDGNNINLGHNYELDSTTGSSLNQLGSF